MHTCVHAYTLHMHRDILWHFFIINLHPKETLKEIVEIRCYMCTRNGQDMGSWQAFVNMVMNFWVP